MGSFLKNRFALVFLIAACSVAPSFFLFYREFVFQSQIDILVFAPHPDDETLCCGGAIINAIKEHKKVKVLFLTNGDGFETSASLLFGKKAEELVPEDYVQLGRERQKEAIEAGGALGLKENDLIFLGYPDGELSFIRDEFYGDYYLSEKTNVASSPYGFAYNSRRGYARENLISDIEDILGKYKPKEVFIPHILDNHKDHQAANEFISLSLDELKTNKRDNWSDSLEVFYYLIHNPDSYANTETPFWPDEGSPITKEPDGFSQRMKKEENISGAREQKTEALKKYRSQLLVPEEKRLIESFSQKDNEIFWGIPETRKQGLAELEREWEIIGNWLKDAGYNVNLGPVADVADDVRDANNPLARRERIFSQDPEIVSQIARAEVNGLNKAGVIPAVKHFPGLGPAESDTHTWLPEINLSKEELSRIHLLPYETLIKENSPFWIIMDHGVYPALSREPASLSFEIQTELLRKEMGFDGIIISDELWAMGAMREYAKQKELKEPFIGELAVRAFLAGTDIIVLHLPPAEADKIVFDVIRAVKEAVAKGRIKEEYVNKSLERILEEKERIFNKPLKNLIKEMPMEEKIGQKIIIDIWQKKQLATFEKYDLGGAQPYNYTEIIKEAQKTAKIPLFVLAQHEGGAVKQYQPDIFTRSAYLTGREFEEINDGRKIIKKFKMREGDVFENPSESEKGQIFNAIIDSLGEATKVYPKLYQITAFGPNPNYRVPLVIYPNETSGRLELKPLKNLPPEWLEKFPDEKTAIAGYRILKEIFIEWLENEKRNKPGIKKDAISQLESIKEKVKEKAEAGLPINAAKIRVLSLATHPDDEDSEGLVYFKRKFNSDTYILLATRGEGGENEADLPLYEDLGKLRTEEMEKAGEILGVSEIYYLGAEDFGYCVSEKEALDKWDKEEILKKIIYFYRLIRPHIIIAKNSVSDEHCQHKAFISLALQAFDMASDSDVEPETLKDGLSVWQPLKFYQRTFNESGVSIDISEKDSLTGQTYKEIARESLRQHRSQKLGEWALSPFWPDEIYYQLIKSKVKTENDSILSGITGSL